MAPTLETYARLAAALGADLTARPYPNTGPRDPRPPPGADGARARARVPLSLARGGRRSRSPSGGRLAVGWTSLLHDPRVRVARRHGARVGTCRRRLNTSSSGGSREKADSLPSSAPWPAWRGRGSAACISRLLGRPPDAREPRGPGRRSPAGCARATQPIREMRSRRSPVPGPWRRPRQSCGLGSSRAARRAGPRDPGYDVAMHRGERVRERVEVRRREAGDVDPALARRRTPRARRAAARPARW